MIAAGWFAGLTQEYIRQRVKDFENLAEDIFSLKGFRNNKVTRKEKTILIRLLSLNQTMPSIGHLRVS
ncbi:hypothetical protein U473_00595 [Tepidibacillus decaturensis]|uniref:Uncharacterized protein n=1 Tax=Tepidibacillus decaturensis TaxID=1413211 RepID=A0A135L133_9BACI|nr:hypothetical protein U473_00595 [Tepidibacillus decaturensis]